MPADLPAGPALDELVAVRVMGWTRLPDSIDGLVVHRLFRSPAGMETSWVPAFSSNIAHAWDVVAHDRADADGCTRWYWTIEERPTGWAAALVKRGDDLSVVARFAERGDTAPLAICRAALAAVQTAAAVR